MDDPAVVAALINEVRASTCAFLEANRDRLARCSYLLSNFDDACAAWNNGNASDARQITDRVNELIIAKRFLQDVLCNSLEYETPLMGIGKTIDFLFHTTHGNRIFFDVKTVHPEEQDDWAKYQKAKNEKRFSPGTELVLEHKWMGGSIYHQLYVSRQRFIEHSLEFEGKIRHIPEREDGRTFFRMVFCSDGWTWKRDHLEDFADTYFTGRSSWDHFATMQAHYLKDKGLELERTILGFCYFERGPRLPEATEFRCDVRGPRPAP